MGAETVKVIEDNNAFLMARGEGSRVEIHAADATKDSWTQIDATAEAGSTTLTLSENTGWEIGDKVVIASTGFDMNEAEYRTITSVSEDGKTITLDAALQHTHFGEIETYDNGLEGDDFQSWELDMRAEVALLSRNVTIQGDEDASEDGYGGHTMIMGGASMHIDGAELTKMGQIGEVGRYPLHWHMLGDASGQYITNTSVHETYNKGITIHGSSNTWLENNAIIDTIGHTYYFEDGSESGNVLLNNLGMNTVKSESVEAAAIGSDHTDVSTYWVTNPNNHLIGNHAAGSDDTGFWILSQETAQGLSLEAYPKLMPRAQDPGTWVGNTSHSNVDDGFWIGSQFDESTGKKELEPRLIEPFRLEDFTSFKNGEWGIWLRNGLGDFEDLKIADSNAGIQMWGDSNLSNSLFVGRSGNSDDTLDQHVGWQMYDHPIKFSDVHFTNFSGENDTAISNGWGFGRSVTHNVEGLTFGDDVSAIYRHTLTIEDSMVSDQGGVFAGAITDIDGSLTGYAGAVLTPAIIDHNPNSKIDVATYAADGVAGFNASPGAILWADKNAWVNPAGTVIAKMSIGEFTIDDERAAGPEGGVSETDYEEFLRDPELRNIDLEDRALYTIERSDNGAKLFLNQDHMVSYSWDLQLNADTANGVEYIIDYTDSLPEIVHLKGYELAKGENIDFRIKGLPEGVVFHDANAAPSLEAYQSATGSNWFRDDNGDYLVKIAGDSFFSSNNPRNDTELVAERVYFSEVKIFVADRDVILPQGDSFFDEGLSNFPWEAADPVPVPERAESTSTTVEIIETDPRWSDAAAWDNGVPGPDDIVIIGNGQRMVLDTDVTVKAILINGGELIVEDTQDLALSADWILVQDAGLFQVGTEVNPFVHEFDLTLEGDDKENDVDAMALMSSTESNIVRAVTPEVPAVTSEITVIDENNSKAWSQYTKVFDADGTILSKLTTYDDGRLADTTYVDGVRAEQTVTDVANVKNWSESVRTYDANGTILSKLTTYDDGRLADTTYVDGVRAEQTVADVDNVKNWSESVRTYDADGTILSKLTTYDDGRVVDTAYTDGVRKSTTVSDLADEFIWTTKEKTFDEYGDAVTLTTLYDDGTEKFFRYQPEKTETENSLLPTNELAEQGLDLAITQDILLLG